MGRDYRHVVKENQKEVREMKEPFVQNSSERMLSHEEFLQQYVLNRASAHTGGLSEACVEKAEASWQRIRELCK